VTSHHSASLRVGAFSGLGRLISVKRHGGGRDQRQVSAKTGATQREVYVASRLCEPAGVSFSGGSVICRGSLPGGPPVSSTQLPTVRFLI
jgi:hypothetical protein